MASRLQDVILRGLAAAKPAANTVAPGTLYYSTDTSVTERSSGVIWETYADGAGSIAVHAPTHSLGGTDPIDILDLAGYVGSPTLFLNGAGGFSPVIPSGPTINLIVKSSDESINSAILQNDDSFLQAVGANETWIVEGTLFVTGSTTGDLQWAWNSPVGAIGWNSGFRLIAGATLTSADLQTSAVEDLTDAGTRSAGLVGTSTPIMIKVNAVIINGITAGTWQFRWCELATDAANPTIIHSGSYMIFMKKV